MNYKYGEGEIGVFMPAINAEKAKQTAEILKARAGIACNLVIAIDVERKGFIATVNQLFRQSNYKYVVYTAEDAFPGMNWLKIAHDELERTNKGLLAFNDGKWFGRLAAFGMARSSWLKEVYPNGDLLWSEYHSHYADNELTMLAVSRKMYAYNRDALLVEVDHKKGRSWSSNQEDRKLFSLRKEMLNQVNEIGVVKNVHQH
jgi:hypothetical protein